MSDTQPVLRLQDLVLRLRANHRLLLDRVSLHIHAGEIFALIGESGSGKSLTALSILRLLPDALEIQSGELHLSGQDVFDLPESAMNRVRGKKVAMIFQEPQTSLNPVQAVGDQIAEALQQHRACSVAECRQRVIALLQEVGLPDAAQRYDWYPHQLSGGQKQRVMIAMALACEPDLLIADEPTTALDVTIQKQILDLLKQLCRRRRLAMLLITHDMGVVAEMADTVAVMREGKILEQKPAAEFFSAPGEDYSRQLLKSLAAAATCAPLGENKPLLEVKGLQVWFPKRRGLLQRIHGHTRAVDGVDLRISEGETLALVGESGCGKTTIGRALLRLTPVHGGEISFYRQGMAQRVDHLSTADFLPWRRDAQIIFQDPFSSMNPRFTVREIIEEGMTRLLPELSALERRLQLESLVEKVGLLPEHLERYPHEFSGGQRQRIAIARALAVKPRLIICDEPTSALDLSIREQILQLLKKFQQQDGVSYLFITHDLALVPRIAHRVAVMKEGRIVEQGEAATVLTSPREEYTRSLLAAVPRLPVADRSA